MTRHTQTWVKINVPVDRGVADLVKALSAFPQLQTLESCENIKGWGWVTFVYGNHWEKHWEDLAAFVLGFLGPRLAQELGDRARISIHVVESGLIRAEMAVTTAAIPATIEVLKTLRKEFKD